MNSIGISVTSYSILFKIEMNLNFQSDSNIEATSRGIVDVSTPKSGTARPSKKLYQRTLPSWIKAATPTETETNVEKVPKRKGNVAPIPVDSAVNETKNDDHQQNLVTSSVEEELASTSLEQQPPQHVKINFYVCIYSEQQLLI